MEKLNTLIIRALVSAGNAIMDIYAKNDFGIRLKSDDSPVTEADKVSAVIINNALNKLFPDIPVVNEETGIPDYSVRKKWKRYFLVDPLDGTKEFIDKNGEFCINIALVEGESPVAGWIYVPVSNEGYCCGKGNGIMQFDRTGKQELYTRKPEKQETLRITISRSFFNPYEAEIIEKLKEKTPVEVIVRGSSLKHISIFKGEADMYLKAGPCSEWDTAPGQLMVEEIGGAVLKLSDFQKMTYNKPTLINPFFVMLSPSLNITRQIELLREVIHN